MSALLTLATDETFVYYFVDLDSSTLPRNKKNADSAKRSVSDSDMNGHKVSSGKHGNFSVCLMKCLPWSNYLNPSDTSLHGWVLLMPLLVVLIVMRFVTNNGEMGLKNNTLPSKPLQQSLITWITIHLVGIHIELFGWIILWRFYNWQNLEWTVPFLHSIFEWQNVIVFKAELIWSVFVCLPVLVTCIIILAIN